MGTMWIVCTKGLLSACARPVVQSFSGQKRMSTCNSALRKGYYESAKLNFSMPFFSFRAWQTCGKQRSLPLGPICSFRKRVETNVNLPIDMLDRWVFSQPTAGTPLKNQVSEQIQVRKVKARLPMLAERSIRHSYLHQLRCLAAKTNG